MKIKLVELEQEMEQLQQRPTTEQVLMLEHDKSNSGYEAQFQLSSKIGSVLKEIKSLLNQKAVYELTFSLHQKLSEKSIKRSNQIFDRINLVIFVKVNFKIQKSLQSYSMLINSLIQRISHERTYLLQMISISKVFESTLTSWNKEYFDKMVRLYIHLLQRCLQPGAKISKSLIKNNHSFVNFLCMVFGLENGSNSGEVVLLPLEEIIVSLQNQRGKWESIRSKCKVAIQQLEKLLVSRYSFTLKY